MNRKIIRAILGPIKIKEEEYRIRINEGIKQELEDIISKIKQSRVRWLGHVWRARNGRLVHSKLQWNPGERRRRGPRPSSG